MFELLSALANTVGWMVHPLAALALAFWGSVIFSRRGRTWQPVALAAGLIVLLAVLGAEWVVHPAAGMLLGFLGSRAFRRWQRRWPGLLAGLVAGLFFMALGAGWLIFPLFVMGIIWVFTAALAAQRDQTVEGSQVRAAPRLLPEQAGGLPMGGFSGHWTDHAEAQAARRQARRQAKRLRKMEREAEVPVAPPPLVPDPVPTLAAYVRDERLPGEARAQLAALDLRTREALTHLEALDQQGSEAAFLARAVRDEYAPTAVQAYLKLPPTLANSQPLQEGKTGRDLLREQLDILLNAVQDILGTALRSGGQELLTHQRFLEEKFRKTHGDLEV